MAVVPRIGTEFAGYRIEALLGRGGMSVVYRAENARLGNKVALKLLAEELAGDESFRERFVRESRTAATLNHPNIVTIYDAGDWEGCLYIAMRWVEEDLKAHLRREGPLAPDHALAVAAQVGSALDAAHARGLLHRDVKPANILLEPGEPGAPPIAYLADFGLTKHLESRSGITASGQFVGTIDYMAPEQIEGREVDSRTDIYSLGCVVFESLAGATPFRRETEVAVLWAHMREDPPPLTEVRAELPREVDAVLAKAMAKAPEDRYANCRDFVADLRAVLGTAAVETYAGRTVAEPTPTVPATLAAAVRRSHWVGWRRRLPVVAAVVALLTGAVLGAVGYGLIRDVEPQIIPARRTALTPDELSLLGRVPVAIRPSCRPAEPPTPDFFASVVCTPSNDIIKVQYSRAASARLARYFSRRVIGEQLGTPPLEASPDVNCSRTPSVREWVAAGKVGHRPREVAGSPQGRFICYPQSWWAAIEWTDARVDIYTVAYGREIGRLFRWWRAKAGPTAPG